MKGLYRLPVTVFALILFAVGAFVASDALSSHDAKSFVNLISSGVLFAIGVILAYAVWTPTEYERGKGFLFRFRRVPVSREDINTYDEFFAMKKRHALLASDPNAASTANPVSSHSEGSAFTSRPRAEEEPSSFAVPI